MSLLPYITCHLLEETVSRRPDSIAVKHRDRVITYSELHEESLRMKSLLLELGVKKGDRVGILLEKSIEQLVCMFGATMAGAVFVFISPVLKKKQIEHIIDDCQISVLVTTSRHYQRSELAIQHSIIFMDEHAADTPFPCWSQIKGQLPVDGSIIPHVADDIACLIYTSGSTGLPKGVVVPHRTLVEGAEIVSSYLDITADDRLISVLPFNFDYGLNQATSSILQGATLVLHQFFLPNDLLKVLKEEKITGFAGMTPIWVKLFDEKFQAQADYDFPSLRYITNSGGKVPRSIVGKMRAFFPRTKIYLMYGLTEAFRSTFLPPEEIDRHPDSIGKAIPNVEILVVNGDGEECAPGEPGELVHRGALITRGYWSDPEKTSRVFRNNPLLKGQEHLNETVVFSGDLVKRDEEGFLYFISRRDEMIKTSGYRVSPTEVEEALIEIPGVKNAVVFGREMANGDQGIVAVIETNSMRPEEKTLLQECRKRLPTYMVPHAVYFEESFKTTANGKIDRSLIKQKWMDQKESHGA